ncbi:hypothetical protein MNEG_1021 [Monoraphidium neglectum]|uniref:Uncharacterized protein n=1 Tax=Monoraphidium neglectum TaxID=145388 RepID=A0A0D2LKJ4_9CHLO|nr:hypothetical protein MNEG_1021 [Monoraphidium neglectum]KIZ06929.1 hypothetical protein MNEG_1021 [Monoraphidium neglectum]|eukprot:XP_013905948.1 hypothetical protein MNEG_1021 [Monoraphidium neglectum]
MQLEDLTVGQIPPPGAGTVAEGAEADEDDGDAQRSQDAGTSAEALAAFARHCPGIRKLAFMGSPSIRAGALEAALLAMPSLEELRLHDVRRVLQPLSGLDKALQTLLAAAWGGGRRLRALEARRCPLISNKTLKLLCQGPGDHTSEQQQQQQQAVAATPGGVDSQAAAAGAVPAPVVGYPHLVELDLTGSCVAPGITINIEALQGSCPALEVLSLEGVGGFYGWYATRPPRGAAPRAGPGWPALRWLVAGAMQQRFQVSQRATLTRSTLDDELLLRLAAGARGLARLGLRGSGVTADGLRALVLGVPLGSGPADEEDERHSGDAVSAGAAAAASQKPGPGLRELLASPAGRGLRQIEVSSCRSLSRSSRQAAAHGLEALRRQLAEGA